VTGGRCVGDDDGILLGLLSVVKYPIRPKPKRIKMTTRQPVLRGLVFFLAGDFERVVDFED